MLVSTRWAPIRSSCKWSDRGSPYKWPKINGFHCFLPYKWNYGPLVVTAYSAKGPSNKSWNYTRWAPTNYKWSYNPYKWPYKWITGVITPISGVITLLITGRGPTLYLSYQIFVIPKGLVSLTIGWGTRMEPLYESFFEACICKNTIVDY